MTTRTLEEILREYEDDPRPDAFDRLVSAIRVLGHSEKDTEIASLRAEVARLTEERAGYKDEADRLAREWRRADEEAERVRAALADTRRALIDLSARADAAESALSASRALADRLAEALGDMAAQNRCGCGHPACKSCSRDRACFDALRAHEEARP